jgi:transposase-like protein
MSATREDGQQVEVGGNGTGAPERREPERSEGERSGGAPVKARQKRASKPDPEVLERPKRRTYTAAYKKKIVEETRECTERGEIGAILRREGLYWSTLSKWRDQYDRGLLDGRKRGPNVTKNPLEKDVRRLEKENAKLKRELERAEAVIEVQKKVSDMLGLVRKTEES